ncbi:MAG: acyltransferase [Comamonadaceae bacterium]|nr:acyltransferase [Comamonadaceae bacterium]
MTPTTRNIQIDALRAIAAILVLITHASGSFLTEAQRYKKSTWLYDISHAIDFGRIGVIVFFIISGYVISNTFHSGITVKNFVIRRVLRLYPLYWLSVIGAYFIFFDANVDTKRLIANVLMIPIITGQEPLMGLYWTLEAELFFYAIAIALFAAGLLRKQVVLLTLAGIFLAIFSIFMFSVGPSNLSLKSLPLNLCFMLIGVSAHIFFSTPKNTNERFLRKILLTLLISLTLTPSAYSLFLFFSTNSPDNLRWGISYPIAVAAFFTMMYAPAKPFQPLARLGIISYSVYLLHPLVIEVLKNQTLNLEHAVGFIGLSGVVLVVAAIVICLSALTYKFLESPFISLAKRMSSPKIGIHSKAQW